MVSEGVTMDNRVVLIFLMRIGTRERGRGLGRCSMCIACRVPEGSVHHHATCPHSSLGSHSQQCALLWTCLCHNSLPHNEIFLYLSLSLFILPSVSVVLSVIKEAQSTLEMLTG